jgi:hypothetical protein
MYGRAHTPAISAALPLALRTMGPLPARIHHRRSILDRLLHHATVVATNEAAADWTNTSTTKPTTGKRRLVRDEDAIARVRSYEQFRLAPPLHRASRKGAAGVTDKDHDQTSDEVTGETTSAFPSADFLNEPDALPTWAPTPGSRRSRGYPRVRR